MTVQLTLELLLRHGMNPHNGMIIRHRSLTTPDYVKPYSMLIVFECPLLVKIFLLDDHRVAILDLPLDKIYCLNANAVHQYTLAQIQTFTRPGYKFIIIVLIPINGLATPKLNLSTTFKLLPHLSLLINLVRCLPQIIRHPSEICVV